MTARETLERARNIADSNRVPNCTAIINGHEVPRPFDDIYEAITTALAQLDEVERDHGFTGEEWWWPTLTDKAWCSRIRKDYPENAHMDDEQLREVYAFGWKYADTWDHLGDAREEYEKLADAFLAILGTERETP